jgi:hypothetical protein
MNNLEKNLDRMLITKNWNNILVRDEIRKDILCFNDNFNERLIVEYLHNLSSEQLLDMRQKCFKLAVDHYVEYLLNKIALKPQLKDILADDYPSKYVFKCNVMKDVIECLEYMITNGLTRCYNSTNTTTTSNNNNAIHMPERCVEFSVSQRLMFPLGKRHLTRQVDTIKALRVKLLNSDDLAQDVKSYAEGFAKMEKSLIVTKSRLHLMQTQNVFLKACLTVLLVILIVFVFLFLVSNCFNYSSSNKIAK